MQQTYGVQGKKLFGLKYYIDTDDYYNCLLAEDVRDAPLKAMLRRSRFIFQIATCLVVLLVVAFVPSIDKIFVLITALVMAAFTAAYLYQKKSGGSNEKFIRKLWKRAEKNKGRQLAELSLYEDGMKIFVLDIHWEVTPKDISEIFETDKLFVVRIWDEKGIKCRDLIRIIIPKRIFKDDNINEVRDYLMILKEQSEDVQHVD